MFTKLFSNIIRSYVMIAAVRRSKAATERLWAGFVLLLLVGRRVELGEDLGRVGPHRLVDQREGRAERVGEAAWT